jgi:alanine dehydrogenase
VAAQANKGPVFVGYWPATYPVPRQDWHSLSGWRPQKTTVHPQGTRRRFSIVYAVAKLAGCRTDGEINAPLRTGLITESDIAGEIGEVVTGRKAGRTSDDEITLFDSTGIALQDSATVPLEYERAVATGVGVEKKMIST